MSSSFGRIGRPSGIPLYGLEVSPGHMIARLLPMAWSLDIIWRFKPSPKASRSRIVTVPQASEAIVSVARFFCSRAERRKSCRTTERLRFMASQLHGHDGIQPGGVPRREVARDETGQTEDRGRQRGHRQREVGIADVLADAELREDRADGERDREPERSPEPGDQQGLEQELAQHPAVAG